MAVNSPPPYSKRKRTYSTKMEPVEQESPLPSRPPAPELSSAERKELRGIGMSLPDRLKLGREGLNLAFLNQLDTALEREPLLKVRLAPMEGSARKALAEEIAAKVSAALVAITGHTLLLFRPNEGK